MRRISILIACALIAFGCEEDFSPNVEGPRPFAVFGVLLSTTDTQFVRVHTTSAPTETLPGNPGIPGSIVTVTSGGTTVLFRDTLLTPPAGSADTTPVPAYYAAPLRPVGGTTYNLQVQTPSGVATSTMTVPTPGSMRSLDFFILSNPWNYDPSRSITLTATLGPQALGYAIRMVIEHEILVAGVWNRRNIEVPLAYIDPESYDPERAIFPTLTRRVSSTVPGRSGMTGETYSFFNGPYRLTIKRLYDLNNAENVRLLRVHFILYQADVNFFTYYSLANFFQDKYSIRVDQPDYSNINGALGFFGSMTTDTMSYNIPSNLEP